MRLLRYLRGNAIALMALFVALGGTAWAASKVGGGDIKSDAVKARHIDSSQVGASELKPGSVTAAKLVPASRSLSITDNPQSIGPNFTDVLFDEFEVSDDGGLQPAETFVVVDEPGVYSFDGEVHWSIDATGDRKLRLVVTDSSGTDARIIASDRRRAAGAFTSGSVSATEPIEAGSVVSLQASQSSAAPLPLEDFDGYSARLSVQDLGPPADDSR